MADDGFEAMYRRELTPMIALALSLTGDRDVSIELAHEAMVRAYREWHSVGQLERPGAWVRRVLINLAIDRHRRAGRERRATTRLADQTAREPVATLPHEADPAFWAAVQALPERERAAIVLHYVEDQSLEEIAATMQIAIGTVKSSLFRARRTLAVTLRVEEVSHERPR